MTARLFLDEMFHPRVATELNARGHDCLAVVADTALRGAADAELVQRAVDDDRTLVTNNVVDFERLRRQRSAAGEAVPQLIYTSDIAFPRNRRFIGRLIAALDEVCRSNATTMAGGVWWLDPAPERDAT